jgi:hypothetical protein
MRIGTWNVDYAKVGHLPDLQTRLNEHPADIWILTETNDDLRPAGSIFRRSSDQRCRAEAPKDVRARSRWVTVWSRFPIMKLHGFRPRDLMRTTAVRLNLYDVQPGAEIIVYGTVLPEKGEAKHAAAIRAQSEEWKYLRDAYPHAILCVAGDFNTDMGRAEEYGYGFFFGPKASTALLAKTLEGLAMRTVTDHGFPEGLKPKYPPIDHIALSAPHAEKVQPVSVWAGPSGCGKSFKDRIGVVVHVDLERGR